MTDERSKSEMNGGRRKRTGDEGEALARQFLEKKGFLVAERNWRCGRGEIDIIARDGATLVFVEVKTQKRDGFGEPEDWITRRKQSQIARTAMGYMVERNVENTECRFDVVTVDLRGETPVVHHMIDAFWADAGRRGGCFEENAGRGREARISYEGIPENSSAGAGMDGRGLVPLAAGAHFRKRHTACARGDRHPVFCSALGETPV